MSLSKHTVVIIIALFVWTVWLSILGLDQASFYVINHWQIAITMIFGSAIAGGTSLGGGAVAFPLFTKLLHIPPHDAKVFSLAIQSVGMSAASLAIILTKIKIEWRVIRWGTLGGSMGIFLGLACLAPAFPPDIIKMSFTMMLGSFAITLLALNKKNSQYHLAVPNWNIPEKLIFLFAGILGGMMSGLVGNGIDIVLFSVMVLLCRISEKIATPTSVILMAMNAIIGFALQIVVFHDFTSPVQDYWFAAIPVVVVGAPLGAMFCSLLHRQTIANILISLIFIEVLTSLLLIPLTPLLIASSLIALILFSGLNYWMYRTHIYQG